MTATAAATATVPAPQPHSRRPRLHCCMKNCFGKPCPRKVVWQVDGIGVMCNWCWTAFFNEHYEDIELEDIHRLSEEENDFYGSSLPNRNWMQTKNGKKHK